MDLVDNLKNLKLFDMYGVLLTDKQKMCLNDYLINNLTLSEISEIYNISRQAVNFNIKESLKLLQNYEDKLGFCGKCDILEDVIDKLKLNDEDKRKILDILKG